jgi:hypothetical protein
MSKRQARTQIQHQSLKRLREEETEGASSSDAASDLEDSALSSSILKDEANMFDSSADRDNKGVGNPSSMSAESTLQHSIYPESRAMLLPAPPSLTAETHPFLFSAYGAAIRGGGKATSDDEDDEHDRATRSGGLPRLRRSTISGAMRTGNRSGEQARSSHTGGGGGGGGSAASTNSSKGRFGNLSIAALASSVSGTSSVGISGSVSKGSVIANPTGSKNIISSSSSTVAPSSVLVVSHGANKHQPIDQQPFTPIDVFSYQEGITRFPPLIVDDFGLNRLLFKYQRIAFMDQGTDYTEWTSMKLKSQSVFFWAPLSVPAPKQTDLLNLSPAGLTSIQHQQHVLPLAPSSSKTKSSKKSNVNTNNNSLVSKRSTSIGGWNSSKKGSATIEPQQQQSHQQPSLVAVVAYELSRNSCPDPATGHDTYSWSAFLQFPPPFARPATVPWLNASYEPISTLFQTSSNNNKTNTGKSTKNSNVITPGASSDSLSGTYNGFSFQKGQWMVLSPDAFTSSSAPSNIEEKSKVSVVSFIERNLSWWDIEWRENGVMIKDTFYKLESFAFVENDLQRSCV